jgi:hypothetical protein
VNQGALSDYFVGVGTKTLRGTEVDPNVSRGHEFQGVDAFKAFLGTPSTKTKIPVTYAWLSDEGEPVSSPLGGTWYDSRGGQPDRTPEYRLYYPAAAEEIVYRAKSGDRLFLCQTKGGHLLALMCAKGSSIEQQLLWLFGLELTEDEEVRPVDLRARTPRSLDITERYVLELIGIEVVATEDDLLDKILKKFGNEFPNTRKFSNFARGLAEIDCRKNPDLALITWMDIEERLFMALERYLVGMRLTAGFIARGKPDVDAFIQFSLTVQNRRKSRAGWALGNHIEEILRANNVLFVREATTEKRNGPDFLFPGETEYHDQNWPSQKLLMLAAKTSCKDRWRQVLAEADRIKQKHLLTLEPGISPTQTAEMTKELLKLVIPKSLHESYRPEQRKTLLSLTEFIALLPQKG